MNNKALTEVIESIQESAESQEELEVEEIIAITSHRALGPMILIPSLFMVSPLSGIPTLPSLCAVFIILVSWQLAMGRDDVWLPDTLKRLSVNSERLQSGLSKIKPWASRLEAVLRPRLGFLVDRRWIGWMVIAVALTVPPLEFLPLAALGPGFVLLLLALGLITKDGLAVSLATGLFVALALGATYAFS